MRTGSAYSGGTETRPRCSLTGMPDLTPEQQLEVLADRRRRVTAAFRLGSEAKPGSSCPSWIGPLARGIAIALAIALVLGIVALARATSTSSSPHATPVGTSSPSRWTRP